MPFCICSWTKILFNKKKLLDKLIKKFTLFSIPFKLQCHKNAKTFKQNLENLRLIRKINNILVELCFNLPILSFMLS